MITIEQITARQGKIALVGLGYVGLPLAVAFAKKVPVIGFDISTRKIDELKRGFDATGELSRAELAAVSIDYTTDPAALKDARFIIVTVPTPVVSPQPRGPINSSGRSRGMGIADRALTTVCEV